MAARQIGHGGRVRTFRIANTPVSLQQIAPVPVISANPEDRLSLVFCRIGLVKPFELLSQAMSSGTVMKLIRRGHEYLILADGAILMSSRMHGSEESLAKVACQRAATLERPSVLIGGLGMGFTLRATLDLLPPDATVVIAEVVSSVVEWNRGPLGPLAGHPLDDKRVRVETGDVAVTLSSHFGQFDAVLLDVDNGPAAFATSSNAGLYDSRGIAAACAVLKVGGVLAVWSAKDDHKFEQRLHNGGFDVRVQRVRGRLNGGAHHTVYLGYKLSAVKRLPNRSTDLKVASESKRNHAGCSWFREFAD
jgi:spermidine synthase